MKRTMKYIAAGLFALWTASCTDEPLVNQQDTLRITGGIATESRTTFVEDGDVTHTNWVAGDQIGLYTNDQSNVPYKTTTSGSYADFKASGSNTITEEEGKKVIAYYPFNANVNGDLVPLPNSISTSSSNPASVFLYSEATINNKELNFTFKHLFAYLKLTITAQDFKNLFLGDGYTLEGCGFYINSSEPLSTAGSYYNIKTKELQHGEEDLTRIIYECNDIDFDKGGTYTYLIPILPQAAGVPITINLYYLKTQHDGNLYFRPFIQKDTPEEGFLAGNVYCMNTTEEIEDSKANEKQALQDLYESTNGDEWYDNTNWLSDKSYDEWYGVNEHANGLDYVYDMDLSQNNLTGTIPASFSALMDKAYWLDLSMNKLTGTIPDAVKNHSTWSRIGWGVVVQDQANGDGLDLLESNLYPEDSEVSSLTEGTDSNLYDLFKQNKLTQVISYDVDNADDIIPHFDASRVNHHLDYQSKGLGTLIFTGAEKGTDNTTLKEGLTEKYAGAEGISWMYGVAPLPYLYYYMSYFFDSNGQLVHVSPYTPGTDYAKIQEAEDAFLLKYLGEPDTTHPKFNMEYYTSTDYSQDGSVFSLQKATTGKGINLILMGEGFVDTDMASGGAYETKMKEAVEMLFSIEPYKTFRNRFNIYGVKVVSPNAEFTSDATHRINNDNTVALEYATKVEGISEEDRRMVVVVYNTDNYVDRSYCTMMSDGSFVAYNMEGITTTLIHEAFGHGFAKLADEYVEGGFETTTLPTEEKEFMDESAKWDWGWFANVDYNSTATTVKWSHLLSDNRYANDGLGIYEGAYTYGKGVYRPSDDSMMRYSITWFNAPSREAIYKGIMTLSEGESWTYSYEDFVKYDAVNRSTSSSVAARSASEALTPADRRKILERHRSPVLINGSWRDVLNQSKRSITVPLR